MGSRSQLIRTGLAGRWPLRTDASSHTTKRGITRDQFCGIRLPYFCCSEHSIHHKYPPPLLASYTLFKHSSYFKLHTLFCQIPLLNCCGGQQPKSLPARTTAEVTKATSYCYWNVIERFSSQASSKMAIKIIILSPRHQLMFWGFFLNCHPTKAAYGQFFTWLVSTFNDYKAHTQSQSAGQTQDRWKGHHHA